MRIKDCELNGTFKLPLISLYDKPGIRCSQFRV